MNKNKITLIVILIIIVIIGSIIFLISNNSAVKKITPEIFEQKAKEQGFTIGEIENLVTQNKPITATKLAVSSDNSYFIEMYVLESEDATKEFYNEKKQLFEKRKQEGEIASETNKKNYDIYTLKSNGRNMYVKRTENVLISYTVNDENQQKVSEFINSL